MARPRCLWLLVWLLVPLVSCVPSARADATSDRLRQAVAAAREGDHGAAVRALPPAGDLRREHLQGLWDAVSALREPRPSAAAHLLAAIRRLDPGSSRPRIALESLWTERPALATLYPDDLWLFPVDAEMLSLRGSPGRPAATVATLIPRPFLAIPSATEPRSGKAYSRVVTAYVDRDGALALRFVVHFTGAVDESRARRIARFLGALSVLGDRMLGSVSRAAWPVHVWLSPDGRPGAEQWAGAITIHRAQDDRSALEWVRQLAHEWGHAALPGVQGFTEPEAWANGDLGERLFLPEMAEAGWLAAWEEGLDAAPYTRRYVDPLIAAFASTGPVPALVKSGARDGYDHFLGAALYVAAAYGTPVLAAAFEEMEGQRAADFLAAFSRTLAGRAEWTVRLPGSAPTPAVACFPMAGEYILEGRSLRRSQRPLASPSRLPAGWVALEWEGSLTVRPAVPAPSTKPARPAPRRAAPGAAAKP